MATSAGSVVTLVNTDGMSLSGPGFGTGVPADDLDAGGGGLLEQRHLLLGVDAGVENAVGLHGDRLLQRRGAAGHRALAIEAARTSQPSALAASAAPSAAPCAPPLRPSVRTMTTSFLPTLFGPEVGPSHLVTGAATLSR